MADSRASVLVTAAGTIVAQGIMKGLRLANLGDSGLTYRIVASDASPLAVGLYRADSGVLVPDAKSKDYVDAIVKLCDREKVQAIFVGSDEEIPVLASEGEKIERLTGAKVLADPMALSIGSDKLET